VIWRKNGTRMGGMKKKNYDRSEALWFSPSCQKAQMGLF